MRIIIDERETALYERCLVLSQSFPTIQVSKEVLPLGDILLKPSAKDGVADDTTLLLIERKSFSDLLASIKDGRYEEQSYRLQHSSGLPWHSIVYLLEGMFSQLRNDSDKKIIYSAMTTLHFFKGFSVHRTSMMSETAEWLIHMANKIDRKFSEGVKPYYTKTSSSKSQQQEVVPVESVSETKIALENTIEPTVLEAADYCKVVKKVKKENVTPENIGEIILCQIPGISSVTAIAIMKKYGTFPKLIQELQLNPCCLDTTTTETNGKIRKINKTVLENIKKYLL
jgi:ERCC4-type nuclease